MSDRGLASAFDTELDSAFLRPIVFLELQLDAGTERLHDGIGDITWDSQTWTGAGDLGSVGRMEETVELSSLPLTLQLSGLDATFLSEAMDNDYFLRPAIVYIGALDVSTGALVADPDEFKRGYIDDMEVRYGTSNIITVTIEDEDADLDRPHGELYSNQQQQEDFSGDVGLEFLEQMASVRVVWPYGDQVRFGNTINFTDQILSGGGSLGPGGIGGIGGVGPTGLLPGFSGAGLIGQGPGQF